MFPEEMKNYLYVVESGGVNNAISEFYWEIQLVKANEDGKYFGAIHEQTRKRSIPWKSLETTDETEALNKLKEVCDQEAKLEY